MPQREERVFSKEGFNNAEMGRSVAIWAVMGIPR